MMEIIEERRKGRKKKGGKEIKESRWRKEERRENIKLVEWRGLKGEEDKKKND